MEIITKTRKVKAVKNKRELRQPVKNQIKTIVKMKMGGYGNGRKIAEEIGVTWHELNAVAVDGKATPSLLQRIQKYFEI